MRARIHCGAHEVGGNCIELEHDGQRLVLDLGMPITVAPGTEVPLPAVEGLERGGDGLLGVVLSHPHPDHFGLVGKAAPSVPIYIGEAAARILDVASFYSPMGARLQPAGFLRHRQPMTIGPFTITPRLNDHSAFDAYSMEIEAGGRRLFYSGDIRGHGRKRGIFEGLLRDPPRELDVLLMEGTHVRADSDGTERGLTEDDVVEACVSTCHETRGLVLAAFSPQNIDRLVTVYKAAIRSGRMLVMDLYTAEIAAATGLDTIPQWSWERVRVYLPKAQKARVVSKAAFERTATVRGARIYEDELRARRGELVMVFRASMARELEMMRCLDDAVVVWSMWPGYLRDGSSKGLVEFLERAVIPMRVHHSSGHAFISDLQRLAKALAAKRLVPIHSFAGDRFEEFFERVDRQPDGAWWAV